MFISHKQGEVFNWRSKVIKMKNHFTNVSNLRPKQPVSQELLLLESKTIYYDLEMFSSEWSNASGSRHSFFSV